MSHNITTKPIADELANGEVTTRRATQPIARLFGPRKIGAVYLLILTVIVFGLWVPSTFLQWATVTQVANQNAVAGIMALALVIPLTAGVFDLSIGYTMGLTSVLTAVLLGLSDPPPLPLIILIGLLCGALIGVVNGVVVVVLRVDSFIATLASGSLLLAAIILVSNERQLTGGMTDEFTALARRQLGGFTLPVLYMLAIAVVLWFILEFRPLGRHLRAVGMSPHAARLVGIRVDAIRFASLIVSATVAGFGGIVITAAVGAGTPTIGPPYLLPAFTGAFLGATQFKDGLFNAWGTVVAVLLLGTASVGMALAGVPIWVPYVVTGVILIGALTMRAFSKSRA